jgi:hypothetical protein
MQESVRINASLHKKPPFARGVFLAFSQKSRDIQIVEIGKWLVFKI